MERYVRGACGRFVQDVIECVHSGFFPEEVVLVFMVWKTRIFGPEGLGHSIGRQRASFHILQGQLPTISILLRACPPHIVPIVHAILSTWALAPGLVLRP